MGDDEKHAEDTRINTPWRHKPLSVLAYLLALLFLAGSLSVHGRQGCSCSVESCCVPRLAVRWNNVGLANSFSVHHFVNKQGFRVAWQSVAGGALSQ